MFRVLRRQSIEMLLFGIAVKHAVEAGKDRDRTSYPHLVKEMENSIISIIMCYTSLEGFANSIGLEYYGNHPNEERRKKWWEGVDNSHPMIELNLLSKLNNLLKEVSLDNPNLNSPRSLKGELQSKISNMTEVRKSLVHYRAEFYGDDQTTRLSNDTIVTPEFDIYKYETTIEFFKIFKEVVDEFNQYSRKPYGEFVNKILSEYCLIL